MSALEAGSAVRLALTVRSGNDRVDPDDVTLDVRAPGGTVTSYAWQGAGTVQRDGVGQFSRLVELPEAGTWRFTWATTGAYQVVRSGTLYVEAPTVEPGSGDAPAEDPGSPAPTVYTLEADLAELVARVDALEGTERSWSMPLVVNANAVMTYTGAPVTRLAIPRAATGHVPGASVDLVIPAGSAQELATGDDMNVTGAAIDPSRPFVLSVQCVTDDYLRAFGQVLEARDETAPTLLGARVVYAAANVLRLTFSEPCVVVTPSAITLNFSVGTPRTVVSVASEGATEVELTLSGALSASDVLTLTTGAGSVLDMNGNPLAPVVGFAVSNEVGDVQFANTIIDLSAETLGAVSASIATWADSSGEGNDFPAASVGAEPIVTDDGSASMPFARFNGSTQWLRRTAAIKKGGVAVSDVSAFSLLFVARIRSGVSAMLGSYVDSGGAEFSWSALLRELGALYFTVDDAATGRASVADAATGWRVIVAVQESNTSRKLYVDGVLVASSVVSKDPAALAFGSIGCAYTGSPPGSGYPAALDLLNHRVVLGALSAPQVADYVALAASRYGVP